MPVKISEAIAAAIKDAKESGAWDRWRPKHSPGFLERIDKEYAEAFSRSDVKKETGDGRGSEKANG